MRNTNGKHELGCGEEIKTRQTFNYDCTIAIAAHQTHKTMFDGSKITMLQRGASIIVKQRSPLYLHKEACKLRNVLGVLTC